MGDDVVRLVQELCKKQKMVDELHEEAHKKVMMMFTLLEGRIDDIVKAVSTLRVEKLTRSMVIMSGPSSLGKGMVDKASQIGSTSLTSSSLSHPTSHKASAGAFKKQTARKTLQRSKSFIRGVQGGGMAKKGSVSHIRFALKSNGKGKENEGGQSGSGEGSAGASVGIDNASSSDNSSPPTLTPVSLSSGDIGFITPPTA